jgi:condensation domain-containing protein
MARRRGGSRRAEDGPVMIVGRFPLSYGQQGIWFDQELRDATNAYGDCELFRVRGRLDLPVFRSAIDAVVRRHDALRTRFVQLRDEPVQLVDDRWRGTVRADRADPGRGRAEQIEEFVRRVTGRPFELERGPLFRVDLLGFDDNEHLLAITLHHLITDGWSMRLLLEQISQSYEDVLAGRPASLAEPEAQYGDFAIWQRKALLGTEFDALSRYWVDHVSGAPAELDLRGSAGRGVPAEIIEFELDATTVDRLREFARSCGATLFMALLGTFEVVLSEAAGSRDLLIGVPAAGRTTIEFGETLGFFVNLLSLRADLRDNPTGAEVLRRARRAVLGGFAHQDFPFERLVSAINPDRSLDAHPLVQATIQLIEASFESALRLADLEIVTMPVDQPEIAYALMLDLIGVADGLRGRLTFDPALVDRELARDIAGRFARVAELLPMNPEWTVEELAARCEELTP